MPSAFDQEFSAVALPDLLAEFSESVARLAAGAEGPVSVTAIVTRHEPTVNHHHGRERVYERTLLISAVTTVAATDLWSFDNFAHTVLWIGDVVAGMRKVHVKRAEIDSQRESNRKVL